MFQLKLQLQKCKYVRSGYGTIKTVLEKSTLAYRQ